MSPISLWIWLSAKTALPDGAVSALLEHFGSPIEIYGASPEQLAQVLPSPEAVRLLADKDLTEADRILADCSRTGIEPVTLQDAVYPDRLRHISDPPPVLYIKGRLPRFDMYPAVGVVGTRKPSVYGLNAAKNISEELADAGVLIVSGLAAGCDAAAHSGALYAGAPTVAVLGCGPDICYPRSNQRIYEDIPFRGAIVSEHAPGTEPRPAYFPRRNRIISGLSNGILVVEAPMHSGALITADFAVEQNRDVYAVPGPIDSPLSGGCNALIQQGAKLVTGAADILTDFIPIYGKQMQLRPFEASGTEKDVYLSNGKTDIFKPGPDTKVFGVTPEEKITSLLRNGPMFIDDIAQGCELPIGEVTSTLTLMELDGSVTAKSGGIFTLNK